MWPVALVIFAHEVGNAKGVGYDDTVPWVFRIFCSSEVSLACLSKGAQWLISIAEFKDRCPCLLKYWRKALCGGIRLNCAQRVGRIKWQRTVKNMRIPPSAVHPWLQDENERDSHLEQCTISKSPYFCPFILTSYLFKSHLRSDFQAHFHFCHEVRSWVICLTCSL